LRPGLAEELKEWLGILKSILVQFQTAESNAGAEPLADLVEVIIVKCVVAEVQLIDDLCVLHTSEYEIKALLGQDVVEVELDGLFLGKLS